MSNDTVPVSWEYKRNTQHSCATSEFHSYLTQVVFSFEVICFHCVSLCSSVHENLLSFSPSPPHFLADTMTSADFWAFSYTSLYRLLFPNSCPQLIAQISPGKNAYFHSIYLPHLHHLFRIVLGFVLSGKLAQQVDALYAVRVPQTGALPPTSFRFLLTEDTLVLS